MSYFLYLLFFQFKKVQLEIGALTFIKFYITR